MDSDEIAAMLCRASDLRDEINHAIATSAVRSGVEEGEEDDKAADGLLEVRDALESLEEQLAALQNLQQQQRYEHDSSLSEINQSRKFLLKTLKEYKGPDLPVIHEASTFAGGVLEDEDDLLLPPYPRRLPDSIMLFDKADSIRLGNTHSSRSRKRSLENGVNGNLVPKATSVDSEMLYKPVKNTVFGGMKHVLGYGVKAIFTILGVISVLRLSGMEVSVRKNNKFNVVEVFKMRANGEKHEEIQCPPGKISIIEDGQQICVVKERVEIPFEPVAAPPDVTYGCG